MKQILIPTDFSGPANNAIRYARQLFRKEDCTFIFLNSYTPSIPSSRFMGSRMDSPFNENSGQHASVKRLQETLAKTTREFPNPRHTFQTVSSYNVLVQEVENLVLSHPIDYIVLSSQGAEARAEGENILGSQAVRILKGISNLPILMIPPRQKFAIPRTIVFVTDYMRMIFESELAPLITIASGFQSNLQIVSPRADIVGLNPVQLLNLENMKRLLRQPDLSANKAQVNYSLEGAQEGSPKSADIEFLSLLADYRNNLGYSRAPFPFGMRFESLPPVLFLPGNSHIDVRARLMEAQFTGRN